MVLNSRSSTTRVSVFIGLDRPLRLSVQATCRCGGMKVVRGGVVWLAHILTY
jgi:hypothetical protein